MTLPFVRSTRGQAAVVVVLGLAGLALAGVVPRVSHPAPTPREITVVARDMAFYVNGGSDPNPRIRVEAGETIRLVLRNEQPGVTHVFGVRAWRVATERLKGRGRGAVVFRVPEQTGRYAYQCSPHSEMMQGTIEVVGARSAHR